MNFIKLLTIFLITTFASVGCGGGGSVSAPTSLADKTYAMTFDTGQGIFATFGEWQVAFSSTGNTYDLASANAPDSTGTSSYTASGNQGRIAVADSANGDGDFILAFTSSTSGTYRATLDSQPTANLTGSFFEIKFSAPVPAVNCVAEQLTAGGLPVALSTNPASCTSSSGGWATGVWEVRRLKDGVNSHVQKGLIANNMMEGYWESRFTSGIVTTLIFVNNIAHGISETRLPNGTVTTGSYVNGNPHGRWETLLPDGSLMVVNWVNGVPQQ